MISNLPSDQGSEVMDPSDRGARNSFTILYRVLEILRQLRM